MEIITLISVIALASVMAIYINDHTALGGTFDESDFAG